MKRGGCLAARNFKGQDFVKFKLRRHDITFFQLSRTALVWYHHCYNNDKRKCQRPLLFVIQVEANFASSFLNKKTYNLQFAVCTSFKIDKIATSNVLGYISEFF